MAWGSNKAVAPKYLQAPQIPDGGIWGLVEIVSAKDEMSRNNKEFTWLTFREHQGQWLHRQSYWNEDQQNELLRALNIPGAIDSSQQLVGQKVWIRCDKKLNRNDNKLYPDIKEYSKVNGVPPQGMSTHQAQGTSGYAQQTPPIPGNFPQQHQPTATTVEEVPFQ